MPGATVSGFVLTNLDEGVKVVDVDLIARGDARTFTFIVVDPSFKATSLRVDFDKLYGSDEPFMPTTRTSSAPCWKSCPAASPMPTVPRTAIR
jgi:hypothetical protein